MTSQHDDIAGRQFVKKVSAYEANDGSVWETSSEAQGKSQKNCELEALRAENAELKAALDRVEQERDEAYERAAMVADSFTCGGCGMDGKAGIAIRRLASGPEKEKE